MRKKVLIIWNRIGPYHHARLQSLSKIIGANNVYAADLGRADSLYKWEGEMQRSYNYFCLSEKPVERFDLWRRLKNFKRLLLQYEINTVAVAGYGKIEYILFIVLANLYQLRIILFAESWYPRNWFWDKLKSLFLKCSVDMFFVSGLRAKDHFNRRLDITIKKIRIGYSVVDNNHFAKKSNINENVNDKPYVLCVARYSIEKNIFFLIQAFRKSLLFKNSWRLVLIGEGPQKEELINEIGEDKSQIILTGWKKYNELPRWYQGAAAFVLPSTYEPWGLVINEALAAGIKTFVSSNCGCAPDFEGVVKVFPLENLDVLVKLFNQLLIDKTYNIERVKSKIDSYSLNNWSNTLKEII